MGASSEYYIKIQDELMHTVYQVENGELNHLDGLIKMRESREQLENSLEIIKEFEINKINEIEREISKYPSGYLGKEISVVPGRKTFSFKGIKEIEDIQKALKETEERYRMAFNGFQKGVIQTTRLNENDPDSPLGWIDDNGQVLPFPELNIGKSFVTVKNKKK